MVIRTKINPIFIGYKRSSNISAKVAETYLLLGSNLGQKLQNLHFAEEKICLEIGSVLKKSSIYQSPPWGFQHDEDFLNQVLLIETQNSPERLLNTILNIEKKLGRTRSSEKHVYLPRLLDIDILFYDRLIIENQKLIIPHPRLHLRRFTLEPLHEIAPDLIHPVFNKTVRELLTVCADENEITKLE